MKHKPSEKRDRSTDEIYASLVNRMLATGRQDAESSDADVKFAMTLGLTSCSDGDGVSTVAFNLARFSSEALQLNTLYLDISNGTLPFENSFLRNQAQVDFQRVLDNQADVSEAIEDSCIERLNVLSFRSGEDFVYSPLVVDQFKRIFVQLKNLFDIVIVDLPPVGGMASGLNIARQLDSVVLVVKSGKTKKDEAAAVSSFLKKANVNLVGALANAVENEVPGPTGLIVELCSIGLDAIKLPFRFARYLFGAFQGRV